MLKSLISFGNRKLPNDTAIFNMCSATDCPAMKLGLCTMGKKCYALKAERYYPAVLPFRRRQEEWWDSVDAEEFVYEFTELIKTKKKRVKLLRVSEAGDFRTQKDVDKLTDVANLLMIGGFDISVYVYTARRDLDFTQRGALQVIGTHFMVDGMFVPSPETPNPVLLPKKSYVCKADCKICSVCSYGQQSVIYAKIH